MRPVRKRLLFATALLLVVLLGLGGWFYFAFYRSTYAAIQHAEAFNFRRLQVAEPDEPGTYRFFYATNRRTGPDQASLETQFANEREAALKFGFFDTAIEPTLGVGMIIAPTEWFQNEVIRLRRVEALAESTFVERLHKRVQDSPQRSLLVMVHGFREAYPSALRKTAFLGHVLDINSPVLLFDWPGDQGSSLTGYRRARRVAEESGAELARTLELVIREVQPERLWLVANSMGGQVVADAFALLHQHADLAAAEAEIEHVVLTAPDVGRDDCGRQFEAALTARAEQLTVYVSSNDRALLMSRVVNWSRRLGESTLSPDMLEEAAQVVELMDPDSDAVTLVDVTPVNRTRNFHNFSLETPEFFDDLYLRLTNVSAPRSRMLYQLQLPNGGVYWVLTRGR